MVVTTSIIWQLKETVGDWLEVKMMTNVGELYVCKICGNAVEVVIAGAGRLVCCGQPMELVEDEE
jgi:desulfoferrodoxin-like iron-binding protein